MSEGAYYDDRDSSKPNWYDYFYTFTVIINALAMATMFFLSALETAATLVSSNPEHAALAVGFGLCGFVNLLIMCALDRMEEKV